MEGLAQAIAAEPDMMLVDAVAEWSTSVGADLQDPIDVLITEAEGENGADEYNDLLYRMPRLRVLAVGASALDGGVVLHELQPTSVELGNVSLAGLFEVIRKSSARGIATTPRPGSMRARECI